MLGCISMPGVDVVLIQVATPAMELRAGWKIATLVCNGYSYFQQRAHWLFSSSISRCLMGELGFPFRRLAICEGLSYAIETTVTTVNLKHAYQTHHRVQGLRLPWFSGEKKEKPF